MSWINILVRVQDDDAKEVSKEINKFLMNQNTGLDCIKIQILYDNTIYEKESLCEDYR
jgi:hypothetical protein